MTLMVTGATGHVGGEILRQAAQRGMDVIAVSRDEATESKSTRRLTWCSFAAVRHSATMMAAAITS